MRHIISILLENESGALSRVSGLFSARAYNIESLTVAPTDDPTMSRITVVAYGNDAVIRQITQQLNKLVDVVMLDDLTGDRHIEREIMLLKIEVSSAVEDAFSKAVDETGAQCIDVVDGIHIVQITDTGSRLDEALKTFYKIQTTLFEEVFSICLLFL